MFVRGGRAFSEREETWVYLRKFSRVSEESRSFSSEQTGGWGVGASNPNLSVPRDRQYTRKVHVSSLISLKTISFDFCLLDSQRFQPKAKAPTFTFQSTPFGGQ